jgi:gliding motility-associated-like protein
MMRKCLLFVTLLMVSHMKDIKAQSLFNAPDTVCDRQPIQLTSNIAASSYYWGFCSAFLYDQPSGTNLGPDPNLNTPGGIEIAKDGINYYGFVVNTATNELVRLNFGPSLASIPTSTNLGTLNNTIPTEPTDVFLMKDGSGNWFMFVAGGLTQATSSLARIDFGQSLANTPNSVNFGNLTGVLNGPRGIFIQEEAGDYIGYLVNNIDDKLIKLDFTNNISLTPNVTDLGSTFSFSQPTDLVAVFEAGNWYLFVTNQGDNTITRIDLGPTLNNIPVGSNIGTLGNKLFGPNGITFVRDCGFEHLLVVNAVSNDITMVDMATAIGPYNARQFPGVGAMTLPSGISRLVRERDNVYAYVSNGFGNSLSQIVFQQCTNSNIQSSTDAIPPKFQYSLDVPGNPGVAQVFNVYLAVNEGLPNMQVECKQITVIPIPQMTLSNDTVICQGDTIQLFVQAFGAEGYTWRPSYNIDDTSAFAPKVWPEYSVSYYVTIPYSNGCIVDTPIRVDVSKNHADAGPDRTINDGAKTILGGPMTTEGPQYTYTWLPNTFINNIAVPNPVVNPPYDFTYYLEVRNTFGCYDIDTVVVRVVCNDINLPNAFAPESKNSGSNRFGIMNKQIIKLNYFRIFDRWGQLAFETTDVTKQWDGTINSKEAPMGVYVWEADGFCTEGLRFKRSGNVTLIR